MTAPRYLFDHDFGSPSAIRSRTAAAIALEQHEAALKEATAAAHALGLDAGKRAQAENDAHQLARSLASIGEGIGHALGTAEAHFAKLEAGAIELALAIGRKIGGAAFARSPLADVEAAAAECFAELRSAPHVVVRLNPRLVEIARPMLEKLAAERGFMGRLVILGEPDIAIGDARCEWADGGFVRDRSAVGGTIARAIERHLASRQVQPTGEPA
jgi:flagellar assembly protein FliH